MWLWRLWHVHWCLGAAQDEPFQLVYKEVMEAFPDTKFVYTDRDPAAWLEGR